MRISDRARREFEFYTRTKLDMIGHEVVPVVAERGGNTAMECWYALDTHGKRMPCSEPELLAKADRGKRSVNLQVKMWAEDVAVGLLLGQRELLGYVHGWPDWVLPAVFQQAGKALRAAHGFVPRFCRLETVHGNYWPPDMDDFDPVI